MLFMCSLTSNFFEIKRQILVVDTTFHRFDVLIIAKNAQRPYDGDKAKQGAFLPDVLVGVLDFFSKMLELSKFGSQFVLQDRLLVVS